MSCENRWAEVRANIDLNKSLNKIQSNINASQDIEDWKAFNRLAERHGLDAMLQALIQKEIVMR